MKDRFKKVSVWFIFAVLFGWVILVVAENFADESKIEKSIGPVPSQVIFPAPAVPSVIIDCADSGWASCDMFGSVNVIYSVPEGAAGMCGGR
jgi:hypothetical protein